MSEHPLHQAPETLSNYPPSTLASCTPQLQDGSMWIFPSRLGINTRYALVAVVGYKL
ncbi:hypothetical protein BofuT4_uP065660.1 [Botrytis cinerea T4]|uniref:Uncharacterized protein n=1 Tax=Botryotinia fuckeliana (strain T4) TaxID=999810 RepID=G2XS08_BOTF4|nr:hypothetical protein BofuT4_uP065660.1 [Botrytis cinerea T4]